MIKAIIFDCFGVLAEDGWTPFKRKHILHDPKLVEEVARLGALTDRGILSYDETVGAIAKLLNVSVAELREAVDRKVPHEDMFELILNELKPHYKIGLLSNANYDVINELFAAEQAALFDAHVLSFETKLLKPDRAMFELMAKRLKVEMNECLFVDDQAKHCHAARTYGMEAFHFIDYDDFLEKLPRRLSGMQPSSR
ncbi:MAG: HAD-superfamily hydrolase, subfamily variant 3 [Candidatus Saccharibacteria bacterium]|nr:HAD-superfamily hydrolase, subfamily variant 3 [Candidatus Saccharibacteria bacterium]